MQVNEQHFVEAMQALTDLSVSLLHPLPTTPQEYEERCRCIVSDDWVYGEQGLGVSYEQVLSKAQEIAANEPMKLLRIERDKLIAETDWWVLPDRTPTQAQLDYRQALRDITETYSSLEDAVFPVKPE